MQPIWSWKTFGTTVDFSEYLRKPRKLEKIAANVEIKYLRKRFKWWSACKVWTKVKNYSKVLKYMRRVAKLKKPDDNEQLEKQQEK